MFPSVLLSPLAQLHQESRKQTPEFLVIYAFCSADCTPRRWLKDHQAQKPHFFFPSKQFQIEMSSASCRDGARHVRPVENMTWRMKDMLKSVKRCHDKQTTRARSYFMAYEGKPDQLTPSSLQFSALLLCGLDKSCRKVTNGLVILRLKFCRDLTKSYKQANPYTPMDPIQHIVQYIDALLCQLISERQEMELSSNVSAPSDPKMHRPSETWYLPWIRNMENLFFFHSFGPLECFSCLIMLCISLATVQADKKPFKVLKCSSLWTWTAEFNLDTKVYCQYCLLRFESFEAVLWFGLVSSRMPWIEERFVAH